jgi:hypothetical protein
MAVEGRHGRIAQARATKTETAASILVPLNAIVRPRDDAKGYAVFVLEEKEGQQTVHERRVRRGT